MLNSLHHSVNDDVSYVGTTLRVPIGLMVDLGCFGVITALIVFNTFFITFIIFYLVNNESISVGQCELRLNADTNEQTIPYFRSVQNIVSCNAMVIRFVVTGYLRDSCSRTLMCSSLKRSCSDFITVIFNYN